MTRDEAEIKLSAIRKEAVKRTIERREELEKNGIQSHLDGVNYYSDIDDWYKTEVFRIKENIE